MTSTPLTFRDYDLSIDALTTELNRTIGHGRAERTRAVIDVQVAAREKLLTYLPNVVATVNAWLRSIGVDVVLRAGRGYFYFTGNDARVDGDSVYVYRAYHLPLERWIDAAIDVIELAR